MTRALIRLADHPANMDAGATMVSGPRETISVFRTSAGYVACKDGLAFSGLFETEQAARDALSRLYAEAA